MIAAAFPGLFTYDQIFNLDYRDFLFWLKESEKKNVQDRIAMFTAARSANISNSDFEETILGLTWTLKLIEKES